MSRRALAPVDRITNTARSITAQNLSKRLDVPSTGDELQRLSETLNTMLERLDTAFSRITRFTGRRFSRAADAGVPNANDR
jgi:HAMP domain-containing protein